MKFDKHPPIKPLVLLLVLSLALVGVSYGLWSETLRIEGTVYTGTLDARWTFVSCGEFFPWPEKDGEGEAEGKDVGSTEGWIDEYNDQLLHIRVDNGYPSYAVDCQVHFGVLGSIPVIVRGTTIIPGTNLTNCTLEGVQTKVLTCDEIVVKFYDNLGAQIHPGDEAASSVMLHIEQPAEQQTTYEFQIGVCLAQWNEDATADQCFAAAQ